MELNTNTLLIRERPILNTINANIEVGARSIHINSKLSCLLSDQESNIASRWKPSDAKLDPCCTLKPKVKMTLPELEKDNIVASIKKSLVTCYQRKREKVK
jgi:hypothetical protein